MKINKVIILGLIVIMILPLRAFGQQSDIDSVSEIQKEIDKLTDDAKKVSDEKAVTSKKQNTNVFEILKNSNAKEKVREIFTPFQKMSDQEFRKLIQDNRKSNSAASFLSKYPKLLTFMLHFVKDKKAPYLLIDMGGKRNLFIIYLIVMIITMVINYKWKKKIILRYKSFIKCLPSNFIRFFSITLIRLGVFILLFYRFLQPTIKIILSL